MTRRAHVVGAGLAGLAAALALQEEGFHVTLHEGSPKAGGRCRSYQDEVLDRRIDNGNHLVLSGNDAVLSHAAGIGAARRLTVLPEATFPFADLENGGRWLTRIPASPLKGLAARPPGASAWEAVRGLSGLMLAGPGRTVAQAVRDRGPMWRAFWEPMATAVLNMRPEQGSAALLRAALRRSFLKGAEACRPVLAPEGLGAALIEPAVEMLRMRDGEVRYRAPLAGLASDGDCAWSLDFGPAGRVPVAPGDVVVLALPPVALATVLPGLRLPGPGPAILNAHFRVAPDEAEAAPPLLGLVGSQAQWLFRRGDVLSVTISAAESSPVWDMPKDRALDLLWSEVARALDLRAARPLARRLLRERSATFDQSPAGAALRPPTRTPLRNVVLAGDVVRTGLPATLEGAVISGRMAARALAQST